MLLEKYYSYLYKKVPLFATGKVCSIQIAFTFPTLLPDMESA